MKSQLIKHLDDLTEFLEPFLDLVNCHMVDFFTKSAYTKYIPTAIRNEINEINYKTVLKSIFDNNKDDNEYPNLKELIKNCNKFTLKSSNKNKFCVSLTDLKHQLIEFGCKDVEGLKLDVFMNEKKSHEVEMLSAIAASVHQLAKTSHILDFGDGKGYLSSILALHYGIPVLGIDASSTNTIGAVKRVSKLSKYWNGIVKPSLIAANAQLYKQINLFVDTNNSVDLKKLVSNIFIDSQVDKLGIIGLHTCGNLATTSLKIFDSNHNVQSICNVGCCYHLLTESDNKGFPMSQHLISKNTTIGRNARMVACQSIDRILFDKKLPNISIFYRAVLQVILKEKCADLPTKNVGRFRKPCDNFVDYARLALKRLDIEIDISNEEINKYVSDYGDRKNELNIFYLIRSLFASVIESLILLDRLLFLYERGYDKSFLVQLFDPVVSPRCYGLISIKHVNTAT